MADKIELKPIAFCDNCGAPIYYGNHPDGMPNGMTFVDCHGIKGNNLTLCHDCICDVGRRRESEGK